MLSMNKMSGNSSDGNFTLKMLKQNWYILLGLNDILSIYVYKHGSNRTEANP